MTSCLRLCTISIVCFTIYCWGPAAGAVPQRAWYVVPHFFPSAGGRSRSSFRPQKSSVITKIQITNASDRAFRDLLNLAARKSIPKSATVSATQPSVAGFVKYPAFQKHKVRLQNFPNTAIVKVKESEGALKTRKYPKSLQKQPSSTWKLSSHASGGLPAAYLRDLILSAIGNDRKQSGDISRARLKLNSSTINPSTPSSTLATLQQLPSVPHQPLSPNFAPSQQWTLEQLEAHFQKPVSPEASKLLQSIFGGDGRLQLNQAFSGSELAAAQPASNDVLDFNITNPATFKVTTSRKKAFQPPVGGKCFLPYSFVGGDGVCIAAKDCPSTLAMMAQFEYTHIRTYLLDSICRWEESGVYYCCPLYSTSTVLPGGLRGVVPLPPVSPAPAPLPTDCGRVLLRNPRIIGGVVVEEGEFPWLASIGHVSPRDSSRFASICSGTLVTRRHVLTAAHCYRSFSASTPTIVRLAEGDLFANDNTSVHADYVITSLHAPLFYYYSTINDVMLLTLDRDVEFNDYIQPACLPLDSPTLPLPGDTVTAVGYGNVLENSTTQIPARYPYRLSLPVIDNSACQNTYYGLPPVYIVDDRVFCEGGLANKSTCKGDSGGPLHYWDESAERYLVVGVVNAGIGCGVAGNPSIDLRVGAFLPWIQAVIAG